MGGGVQYIIWREGRGTVLGGGVQYWGEGKVLGGGYSMLIKGSLLSHSPLPRSFGVLLWEVMTRGSMPYTDFSDAEVLNTINLKHLVLPAPSFCSPPM